MKPDFINIPQEYRQDTPPIVSLDETKGLHNYGQLYAVKVPSGYGHSIVRMIWFGDWYFVLDDWRAKKVFE